MCKSDCFLSALLEALNIKHIINIYLTCTSLINICSHQHVALALSHICLSTYKHDKCTENIKATLFTHKASIHKRFTGIRLVRITPGWGGCWMEIECFIYVAYHLLTEQRYIYSQTKLY